jgi:hypothetical protein
VEIAERAEQLSQMLQHDAGKAAEMLQGWVTFSADNIGLGAEDRLH